jgi:hypothetical protein
LPSPGRARDRHGPLYLGERVSISTAPSENGVAITLRPCTRARAANISCAASSSSNWRKNSTSDPASTCAGAGQDGATRASDTIV